jgi:hypothetical protein
VNFGRVRLETAALNPTSTADTCIQLECSSSLGVAFVPSGAQVLMLGLYDGECRRTLKGHFEPVRVGLLLLL